MSNLSIREKQEEAVKRMEAIGIFKPTINQFKEGYLSQSEPPFGACFWVEGEQLERVKEFERENDALVYFVIHTYSNLGETEEYFYVSDYKEEWEMDWENIKGNMAFVYVHVVDDPTLSEFGTICYKLTPAAGLKRTA